MNDESQQAPAPTPPAGHGPALQPSTEFADEQHKIQQAATEISPAANSPVPAAPVVAATLAVVTPTRQNLQDIYPNPGAAQTFGASSSSATSASNDVAVFWDWLVLGLGFTSGLGYVLLSYLLKNFTWPVIICGVLSIAAIIVAIWCYRVSGKLTLVVTLGISAATFTLMYVGNLAIAYLLASSYSGSYLF